MSGPVLASPVLAAGPVAPPTDVSPLTVMPRGAPPRLVASFPAEGQAVAAGVVILKLTFDQQMEPTSFDLAAAPPAQAPDCLKTPRLLDGGKTFVLLCRTHPGQPYALALNAGGAGGFANLGGVRAPPATLAFTTTAAEPVRSLEAAMKVADLRDIDTPIQDTPGLPPAH
jgi:hypothetical protein